MNYLFLIFIPAILNLIIMRHTFVYLQKIRKYDLGYFRNNHTWWSKSGFIHRYERDHLYRIKMTRKRVLKIAIIYTMPGVSLFLLGLTALAFTLDMLIKLNKKIDDYFYFKNYYETIEKKNKKETYIGSYLNKDLKF